MSSLRKRPRKVQHSSPSNHRVTKTHRYKWGTLAHTVSVTEGQPYISVSVIVAPDKAREFIGASMKSLMYCGPSDITTLMHPEKANADWLTRAFDMAFHDLCAMEPADSLPLEKPLRQRRELKRRKRL
jgi:hypothetical protein